MLNARAIAPLLLTIVTFSGCKRETVMPYQVREVELTLPETAGTPESRRVLVVCNTNSEESIELTEYYAAKRSIPRDNVLQISTSIAEVITETPFTWDIQKRIQDRIKELDGEIDFIVLTKGIPIRVGTEWGHSVDSRIAAMDLDMPLISPGPDLPSVEDINTMRNPYFGSEKRFSSQEFGMYLVTRLDGYDLREVKKMVDRGMKAQPNKGPFLLDFGTRSGTASAELDADLEQASDMLKSKGFEVILADKPGFVGSSKPLAGYISWGSNDPKFDASVYNSLTFLPGAISETFVSTSARSFMKLREGQSQIGDLIRQGVCGVKGYTSEPWTLALARPTILMDRYTDGWTLAESYYAASPVVNWKDIVIGDPLLAPYATN